MADSDRYEGMNFMQVKAAVLQSQRTAKPTAL